MTPLEERVQKLEVHVDTVLALAERLRELDAKIRLLEPEKSAVRGWLEVLGPYVSGLLVLVVGWWLTGSLEVAFKREELDISYAKELRDLVKGFDEASSQADANANAIGLSLFGKHAVPVLIERLTAGDVAAVAAANGLRLIGARDSAGSCPLFADVLRDKARRYPWQSHKAVIRVIGQSDCVPEIGLLRRYRDQTQKAMDSPDELGKLAQRYQGGIDAGNAEDLRDEIDRALTYLHAKEAQ